MIKILIVDDHTIVREGLKQIVSETSDIRVIDEAGTVYEALDKILRTDYDVVVLDISMPGRNGLEVLGQLKSHKPDLRVLILSMHPEEQYGMRVLKLGASGYLTKESAAAELIEAIRKVAAGRKYVSPSLAEKLAFSLESGAGKEPHELLSNREYEVMCMIAKGKTVSDVAEELNLSIKTISTYRSRILDKMDIKNNAELTRYAIKRGLVD
jgi:DNA-binding NarL/FixJ family response regulator